MDVFGNGLTCCAKPNIVKFGFNAFAMHKVNSQCLNCKTHWYGWEGQVKEYSGKEWDALMEDWK